MPRTIELTPEELMARTSKCRECNAPAGIPCHRIEWNNMKPQVMPRRFHSRRLKLANKHDRRDKS